jgi:hypothetical protein
MAKDAGDRRRELEGELRAAKKTVSSCEAEITVLDQILAALKGAAPSAPAKRGRPAGSGRRAKAGRAAAKKPGKWRPGRPGRPPKWYVEQQRAAGGGEPKGRGRGKGRGAKRRAGGRRGGRRKAEATAPAPEAAPAAESPVS